MRDRRTLARALFVFALLGQTACTENDDAQPSDSPGACRALDAERTAPDGGLMAAVRLLPTESAEDAIWLADYEQLRVDYGGPADLVDAAQSWETSGIATLPELTTVLGSADEDVYESESGFRRLEAPDAGASAGPPGGRSEAFSGRFDPERSSDAFTSAEPWNQFVSIHDSDDIEYFQFTLDDARLDDAWSPFHDDRDPLFISVSRSHVLASDNEDGMVAMIAGLDASNSAGATAVEPVVSCLDRIGLESGVVRPPVSAPDGDAAGIGSYLRLGLGTARSGGDVRTVAVLEYEDAAKATEATSAMPNYFSDAKSLVSGAPFATMFTVESVRAEGSLVVVVLVPDTTLRWQTVLERGEGLFAQ